MLARNAKLGGPVPKFNDYHIWKTLDCLDEKNAIGRKRLSGLVGIGEGSMRTVLSILQNHNLVIIGKSGIVLTAHGLSSKKRFHMDIAPISISSLTIDEKDCAVRVPKMARNIKYGCEERDAAIKSGATGATTLVVSDGKIVFPGSKYPVDANVEEQIRTAFNLRNDDIIIIGTAPDQHGAEIGAVTAGLALMGGLEFDRKLKDIVSPRSTGNELLALAFAIHDLVGGLPVCAKSRDNLGIRIEDGAVIDNAYTGPVLEEVLMAGTTIRKIAGSGPYKGIRVIVTPIELDNHVIAVIGVVDIRSMAGVNNLIRLHKEDEL